MTITCAIQPTGAVTMAMKVLHNTCNMCIHDLPDMYGLSPTALRRTYQANPHAHIITITCNYLQAEPQKLLASEAF